MMQQPRISEVIGEGSKIFRDLFGKIEDPRFAVYNGMARLSGVARRNELLENLLEWSRTITGKKEVYKDNINPNKTNVRKNIFTQYRQWS